MDFFRKRIPEVSPLLFPLLAIPAATQYDHPAQLSGIIPRGTDGQPIAFYFIEMESINMKTLTLVASLLLAAPGAFAATGWHLVCNNMASDGGYSVTFSSDGLSAEVEQNSIAGSRNVASLICPEVEPASGADRITTTVCVDNSDRSATDVGYTATLETGGFAGLSRVTLHHGRAKVAVINCESEQN